MQARFPCKRKSVDIEPFGGHPTVPCQLTLKPLQYFAIFGSQIVGSQRLRMFIQRTPDQGKQSQSHLHPEIPNRNTRSPCQQQKLHGRSLATPLDDTVSAEGQQPKLCRSSSLSCCPAITKDGGHLRDGEHKESMAMGNGHQAT
jgi:hypothetical protein